MEDQKNFFNPETIRYKKLYKPGSEKGEFSFEDLYQNLEKNQLVFIIFFRQFGWMFCRAGAQKLTKIMQNIEEVFPNKVKTYGIGLDEFKYEEFIKEYFTKNDVLINKKGTIYKALGYKSPGLLSCFGFCVKNTFRSVKKINSASKPIKTEYSSKVDFLQMGGSVIINQKGKVVLFYKDSFYGDHVPEDLLLATLEKYFN